MRSCYVKLLFVLISFVNSNKAVVFECDFSQSYWDVIGRFYICTASILSADDTSNVNVTGTHLEGYSNSDVLGFDVQGQEVVTRIPRGIENFFPHLQWMQWSYGSLTAIDADDLKPFSDLLALDIHENNIVSLDSDLFQHTPKLQWINFYKNSLQHVGHDLLTNLSNLTVAFFLGNPCINRYAQTSAEVQELNLLLPIQCPPLEVTTPPPTNSPSTTTSVFTTIPSEYCPIECSSRIDELSRQNHGQNEIISQLQIEVSDLNLAIEYNEVRIVELERLVREINSRP